MSDRSNRFFFILAILGIPYAIPAAFLLEPFVLSDRIHIALALVAIAAPTALGAFGALLATPRR